MASLRWALLVIFHVNVCVWAQNDYRGKPLGQLSQLHHAVSGEVFAVDARTLHIRNFNYDGEGPAAYFYVGTSKTPSGNGFRLRDERGTTNVLPRYRNADITLTLPEGKSLQNIRWFSVWCDEFAVNFGDVKIPKNFDFPRPFKLGALSGIHGVSSDPVVIVDAQTLLIPNFSYDGEAPDAKFWVGPGTRPTPQGIKIPDENGKIEPLRRYDRKTIVLTLPGDMTVFNIGHFGVWCEAFTVDFGHVLFPQGLNVPPSLKMLGVSPQKRSRSLDVPNYFQNTLNEESRPTPALARPLFYSDFRRDPLELQNLKPTTYRPPYRRVGIAPRQQSDIQVRSSDFEIQQSVEQSEYVIHDETGEFVKPLDIQFSRKQEVYEPTPAQKIVQANPPEPPAYSELQQDLNSLISYNTHHQLKQNRQMTQTFIQPVNYFQQQQYVQQPHYSPHQQFSQQKQFIHPQPLQNHVTPNQLQQQPPVQQLQYIQQQPNFPSQHYVQQQQYAQQESIPNYGHQQSAQEPVTYQLPPPATTNHFGKFSQMNVETNVNHNHQGSFSRFVINRSTDTGFFHRL